MAATSYRQSGQLLRSLRTDHGWTHEDMSDEIFARLGMKYATSARTIWRAESGHKPSVRKQFAIAHVLGTVPSLVWGDGTRPPMVDVRAVGVAA